MTTNAIFKYPFPGRQIFTCILQYYLTFLSMSKDTFSNKQCTFIIYFASVIIFLINLFSNSLAHRASLKINPCPVRQGFKFQYNINMI